MLVCAFDLETTGLDIREDRIVELGAVLWDTSLNMPMRLMSLLIHEPNAPEISEEASSVNGITMEMLKEHGTAPALALCQIQDLFARSEFVVGYNSRHFDGPMLKNAFERVGLPMCDKPMIDTMTDLPFNPRMKERTLVGVGAYHGFINPFPHRAVTDALSCLKLLSFYPLNEVIKIAAAPIINIAADVPFQRKDEAKKLGYRWHPDRKIWWKPIRDFQMTEEKEKATFVIHEITNPIEEKQGE